MLKTRRVVPSESGHTTRRRGEMTRELTHRRMGAYSGGDDLKAVLVAGAGPARVNELSDTALSAEGICGAALNERRDIVQKIVVNKCYGGFGVSPACLWQLIQRKAACLDVSDLPDYFGAKVPSRGDWKSRWEECRGRCDAAIAKALELPSGWFVDGWVCTIYDANAMRVYHCNRDELTRTDPTLLALMDERGSEWCSGKLSKLEITEIPADVSWEIDEYDGMERVAETHRTW